jgi:hypothetical protein
VELDEVTNEAGRSETEDGNELQDAWMRSRSPFIGPRRRETDVPRRRCGGRRVPLQWSSSLRFQGEEALSRCTGSWERMRRRP